MWVKICANTNLEDALQAAALGADALGFVFAKSPRQVTPEQVRAIVDRLPPGIERVGVFAAASPSEIASMAQRAGLTAVQLHNGLHAGFTRELRPLLPVGVDVLETMHWQVDDDHAAEDVAAGLRGLAPGSRVLIDAKVGAASGGMGVAFDWTRAAAVFAAYPQLRLILAGGLRPETVAEAMRVVQPWGIDVASGVEQTPGAKDPEKLRAFLTAARV